MSSKLGLGGSAVRFVGIAAMALAAGCAGTVDDGDVEITTTEGAVAPRCFSKVDPVHAFSAENNELQDDCLSSHAGGSTRGGWNPAWGIDLSDGDPTHIKPFVDGEGKSPGNADQAAGEAEVCAVANTACIHRCQALPLSAAATRTACLSACKEQYKTCTGKK